MREALANANRFLHRKKEKEVEILDLKNLTFRGGVHPDGNKDLSNQAPITRAKEPALVSISMHQHTGAPCEPTVQVGDTVKIDYREYRGVCIGADSCKYFRNRKGNNNDHDPDRYENQSRSD